MRVLSIAVVLFVTGCSGGYRLMPASEPVALAARISVVTDWEAEKKRRTSASREAVTTYLALHPEREAVRDALLADRLAVGMTIDEVKLVLPGREIVLAGSVFSAAGRSDTVSAGIQCMPAARTPAVAHIATLGFHDGALVSWATGGGDVVGGPNLTTDMLAYRGPR